MRGIKTEKTKELDEKIIELYKTGVSRQKISGIVHVSTKYVSALLDGHGFKKRETTRNFNYDEVAAHYKVTKNCSETAKVFGTSPSHVAYIVKKYNCPIYYHEKLYFNEHVFDKIDTEEKAYWLGFIYADGYVGNINDGDYSFGIGLSAIDLDHLIKFNQFIDGNPKIIKTRIKNGHKACEWRVHSRYICETLMKCGILWRKTHNMIFPDLTIIPENFQYAFIRGYFDGDGCIMTNVKSHKKIGISIVGTENFLLEILKILKIETRLVLHNTKNMSVYYINLKVLKSIKFCQKIYNNPIIFLTRKYNKWLDFCRSNMKMLESLRDKFGEDWDVNSEVISYVNYKKYCNA